MKLLLLFTILLCQTAQADTLMPTRRTQDPEFLWQLTKELAGARLSEPIYIADMGTGDGEFIPKIKAYFEGRGFERVVVAGIDNGLFLGKVSVENVTQWNLYVRERLGLSEDEHYLAPSHKLRGLFDVVFLNAPHRDSIQNTLPEALDYLKPRGFLVIRLHAGDEISGTMEPVLYGLIKKYNLAVKVTHQDLPQGSMALGHKVYLVSRSEITWSMVEVGAVNVMGVENEAARMA